MPATALSKGLSELKGPVAGGCSPGMCGHSKEKRVGDVNGDLPRFSQRGKCRLQTAVR